MIVQALITLALLWLAFLIVVYLHEMGHGGKSIRIIWGILPYGASMQSRWKLGGLTVNLLLAYAIFYFKPENILLQYIGLVSWVHFILYVILGSFDDEIPRKKLIIWDFKYRKAMGSFFKTHIFDDVPNELWFIFVPLGVVVFIWMRGYYIPILNNIWNILIGGIV